MGLVDLIELDINTPSSLPSLGVIKVGLHLTQILFAFITFCIVTPIISIERYYYGSSQAAPNYTLVVTLVSLFVAAPLALFPWTRYRGKLDTLRNFFLRSRSTVIFTCFLTLGWFVAMISMTVHANNASNCALNAKLQKSDSSYAGAWMKQCNSAKAAAAFSWFSFFLWLATAICSSILLWHEKKLRHAAAAAAIAKASGSNDSSSHYDEDARTIVDMEYSEKDKQPVAHYDTISSAASEEQQASPSLDNHHPLPVPPSAPPISASCFTSPYAPNAVINNNMGSPYATLRATPSYIPQNLVSPYTPQSNNITTVGSPYSIPASVVFSYPVHNSPYNTTISYQQQHIPPQQQYAPYNSPSPMMEQQSYNNNPVAYQCSPLAYSSPIVSNNQQSFHPMTSYQQQEYPTHGHN